MKVCLSILTTDSRNESFRACLDAIDRFESDPGTDLHLLIVQNGVSEPTERVMAAVANRSVPVTVRAEPRRGIPFARNHALDFAREAGIPALAFIDDDAVPDRSWLREIVAAYTASGAEAVTGPQVPVFAGDAPARLRNAMIYRERRLEAGSRCRWAASNNVLFSVDFAERNGLRFNEAFRTGGSDKEFFMRFTDAGGRILWTPAAIVREAVTPERLSVRWAMMRAWRLGTTGFSIERSVRSDVRAAAVACGKGLAYIGLGVVTLPKALAPKNAGLVDGLCYIAHGTGFLAGLNPRLRIKRYV